jgi:hypothetical protein
VNIGILEYWNIGILEININPTFHPSGPKRAHTVRQAFQHKTTTFGKNLPAFTRHLVRIKRKRRDLFGVVNKNPHLKREFLLL